MKASEVIAKLQEQMSLHGDCNVEYPYEIEFSKGRYNKYGSCDVQEIRYEPDGNCFYLN